MCMASDSAVLAPVQAYATNPIFGVEYDASASVDVAQESTTP